MLKFVLKLIKWYFLFWIYVFAGTICAGIVIGIFEGILGLSLNEGVLVGGFTLIFLAEGILKARRKKAAANAETAGRRAAAEAEAAAEAARAEEERLKDEIAVKLDGYRQTLERQARKIKDRPTAEQVNSIAATLNKIAMEVEEDSRDRKKVRSLSDHSGAMIVDLVEKYIKLESQNQITSNIAYTMRDIRSALDTVDTSLKTLLDDLFSNDVAEVATNIAVLENILNSSSPENRIRMEDIAKAGEMDFAGEVTSSES